MQRFAPPHLFSQICLLFLITLTLFVGKCHAWNSYLRVSPTEVWAKPGETVSVTFTGVVEGDYNEGNPPGYRRTSVIWSVMENGSVVANSDTVTKTIVLPDYGQSYTTSLQATLSYVFETVDPWGNHGTSGPSGYFGTCIIHVDGSPPTKPTPPIPTPLPTPPTPTVTPLPPVPPLPPIPYPSPLPPVTPTPMPTATPTGGVWSPLEKEIGYHRANGGWQADGCMTAPVDQSAACRSGTPAPAPLPSPTVPPLPTPTPWKPTATPLPYPSPTVPPPVDTFPYPYPSPTAPQPIPLPQPYPSPTAPPPVDIFPYPLPTVPPPVDTFPSPYPPSPYPTYPPQPLPTPAYPGVPPGALPLTSASATAPPLASVSAPSDPRVVAAGAEVPCAVQNAQDFDTYTKTVDGIVTKTYGADGPLTYQWSADKGTFKNGITFGQNVTWIAPDDITTATNVIIRCTIDDPPGPRVFAPDTGSHDDDPTVRSATVKVAPKFVHLTDSSPDFVVYRKANTALLEAESEPETFAPDVEQPSDLGGVSVPINDGDGDGSVGNGEDEPAYGEDTPEEELPQPQDVMPDTDPELENPVIKFGVRISGYQTWKAQVSVYAATDDALQSAPLASLETDKTEVSWNDLFPSAKPADGVYFYDIVVRGIMDENKAPLAERVIGMAGDGMTDRRLNRELTVRDLTWTAPNDAPDTNPDADSASEDLIEIKFHLLTASGQPAVASPSAVLVNPMFRRAGQIDVQMEEDGFYHGATTLAMGDAKDFGDWTIFVQAKTSKKAVPRVAVPGARKANNNLQITGMAYGYAVDRYEGAGQTAIHITDHFQMRRPLANWSVTFRSFFRVTRRGVTRWYSEYPVTASDMKNIEWIGGDTPSGYPSSSLELAPDWKKPEALGLRVRWRKFDNNVVDQQDEGGGKYRWYGLKPQDEDGSSVSDDGGLGLTYYWSVDFGVNWWGVRVGYNKYTTTPAGGGKLVPYLFQLPTDRRSKKFLFPTTDTAKNTVSTGYGGRVQQKIWLPDPSTVNTKTPGPKGRVTEWRGFIDGVGLPRQIEFAGGDALGTATQAAFNSKLLEQASSFLNAPYGWGGQDYGGRQSTSPAKARGNVTWSLIGPAVIGDVLGNVGDSHKVFQTTPTPYRTGFGVDCSGLIEESATAAGWSGVSRLNGEGWGSGTWATTNDSAVKSVPQPFLRPGDIIAWRGHILFVNDRPQLTPDDGINPQVISYVDTLEANPDRVNGKLGRTRAYGRAGTYLRSQPRVAYRRLIQP